MKLRALGMKGCPPLMAVWGPMDFADYSPGELRHLYELLLQRIAELKSYLDTLEERQK